MSSSCGGIDLIFRRIFFYKIQVFPQGGIKEDRFLGYETDLFSQAVNAITVDIKAINQNGSGKRIQKTQQQINQGGFPRTAWSHNSQRFSLLNLEIDIHQMKSFFLVAETDVFKTNVPLYFW